MPTEDLFRLLFAVNLFVLWAVRFYHHAKAGTHQEGTVTAQEGRILGGIRVGAALVMMGYPLLYIANPAWIAWSLVARPLWMGWLGLGLATLGLAGIIWVNWALGQHFSTTLIVRDRHELIQRGPYRRVRHPMYTAILAILVGWSLVMGSWLVAALTALYVVLIMGIRTPREEAMLADKFGVAYHAYMARTGRFLPPLKRAA